MCMCSWVYVHLYIVDIEVHIHIMYTFVCACERGVFLCMSFIQQYIHKMFGKCSKLASPPGSSQHA